MNDTAIYEASADYLHATVGYSETRKRGSAFMWVIAIFLAIPMKLAGKGWLGFMSRYVTTILGRVYWPDGVRNWRTLWHECGHRTQAKRVGEPWFSLSYLFPQVLGLVTIPLAWIFLPWWLALGATALTLGPWPAPWRVRYEREAYFVTAVCDALRGWDIEGDWYVDYQVENHCGWSYWKPAWSRSRVRSWVREDIARALRIVRGEETTPYTDELIRIVKEN